MAMATTTAMATRAMAVGRRGGAIGETKRKSGGVVRVVAGLGPGRNHHHRNRNHHRRLGAVGSADDDGRRTTRCGATVTTKGWGAMTAAIGKGAFASSASSSTRGTRAVTMAKKKGAALVEDEVKKAEDADVVVGGEEEVEEYEEEELAEGEEEESLTIDELKEEVIEEEVEELTVLGRVSEGVRAASENPGLRNLGALGFFFLASTFAYSCYKVFRKATGGRAKRKRTVNKNVEVVERLKNFFPGERGSVNKGVVRGIAMKTGYSQSEIFRKYLRYKLTEEAFTLDFVADVLALKGACGLDSEQMKEILTETGERMFKKYGTLLTDLAGLTQSGVERKLDGASKFAKLMYLADLDEFIDKEQGSEVMLKLKEIFGATDEDYEKLRITALGSDEVDVSSLQRMMSTGGDEQSDIAAPPAEESQPPQQEEQ